MAKTAAPAWWHRHDLLRVEPCVWARILRSLPARLLDVPYVRPWADRGWPVIVRRRAENDAPDAIPVAFPLPPTCGKLRVAVQLTEADVREPLPAVTLRSAREPLPASWQGTVDGLLAIAGQTAAEPLVFGSVLWQWLTGLPYLSPTSDLDLLWPVAGLAEAIQLTGGLVDLEKNSPVRFDGEILLPGGGGVQWREFVGRPSEVLVKTLGGVELRAQGSLFPDPASIA